MKKYFEHKIENLISIDKIITVHYFEFDKNFEGDSESHNFWEIVYSENKPIICNKNGHEVILNPGFALFHKPNEIHSLSTTTNNSLIYIISFSCKSNAINFFEDKIISLDDFQKNHIYEITKIAKSTFEMEVSDPKTKKLEIKQNPTLGGLQLIKNLLEIFLIECIKSLTSQNDNTKYFLNKDDFNDKLTNEIIEFLNNNLDKKITINDIAAYTNYSACYIFKTFKKNTKKTIIEYFNELKIKKIKECIKKDGLSVKELSIRFGFDTPNYLSKTFKKYTNETISEYKKRKK